MCRSTGVNDDSTSLGAVSTCTRAEVREEENGKEKGEEKVQEKELSCLRTVPFLQQMLGIVQMKYLKDGKQVSGLPEHLAQDAARVTTEIAVTVSQARGVQDHMVKLARRDRGSHSS